MAVLVGAQDLGECYSGSGTRRAVSVIVPSGILAPMDGVMVGFHL